MLRSHAESCHRLLHLTVCVASEVGLVRAVRAVMSSNRLLTVEVAVEPEWLGQTLSCLLIRLYGATLRWEDLSGGAVGNSTTRDGVGCCHLSGSLISTVDAFTSNLALDLQGNCLTGRCLLWQGLLDEL